MLPDLETTMAQQGPALAQQGPRYTCRPISCINGTYKVYGLTGRVLARLPRKQAEELVEKLNQKMEEHDLPF